jgi:hypothetical protein
MFSSTGIIMNSFKNSSIFKSSSSVILGYEASSIFVIIEIPKVSLFLYFSKKLTALASALK